MITTPQQRANTRRAEDALRREAKRLDATSLIELEIIAENLFSYRPGGRGVSGDTADAYWNLGAIGRRFLLERVQAHLNRSNA